MSFVPMIIFLAVTVSLLFGVHFFVYMSLVHFFTIGQTTYRYLLAGILGFLSVSFILSSLVAHYYENLATRTAYFLSSFWLGLLVNLMVVCLIAWLVFLMGQWLHLPLGKAWVGTIFFGLALFVSFFGVWQALHPTITRVSVHIPGLPESWKGQTLVQLSDVHLGHVYQSKFLKGVVEQVNALHPKAVVITGDLFDGMDGQLESLVQPLSDIKSEEGIFFVTGNHERYLGVETALYALRETPVTVLNDEVRDVAGLRFIGVSFPLRGEAKKLLPTLESLRSQFANQPNVLLYHAPESIAEVATRGVNLMLSGHTHRGQQFPFQFITALVHKGFDYGLFTIGDFHLYTTSGVGTWGPTMRIGTKSEIVAITLE